MTLHTLRSAEFTTNPSHFWERGIRGNWVDATNIIVIDKEPNMTGGGDAV